MVSAKTFLSILTLPGMPTMTNAACGDKNQAVDCKPIDTSLDDVFHWYVPDIKKFSQVSYNSDNHCGNPGHKAQWQAQSSAPAGQGSGNFIDIFGSIDGEDYYICAAISTTTFDRNLSRWACDCV